MEKDEEEHKEEKKVDYSRRNSYIQKVWKEEGERSSRYLVNIQHTTYKDKAG